MTKERAKQEETILAIQDTTYYNYTHHPKTEGLGVLSKFKGKHKDEILTLGTLYAYHVRDNYRRSSFRGY